MSNQQVATRNDQTLEGQAVKRMGDVIVKYRRSLELMLGEVANTQRFMALVLNNVRTTPKLANCTPLSFINSVMLASQMKIEIRNRSAYLVPFGTEAQLLIDYRSKLELARRNSQVSSIHVNLVHAADKFDYQENATGTVLVHEPLLFVRGNGKMEPVPAKDRGEIVLGYSICRLRDGAPIIQLMGLDAIERIRSRSRSGANQLTLADIRQIDPNTLEFRDPRRVPWVTDYDQMARKTITHHSANYWPQQPELDLSQRVDDANEVERKPWESPGVLAEGLETFAEQLDPADNKPLVESAGTQEEFEAKKAEIVKEKTKGTTIPVQQMKVPQDTPKEQTGGAQEKTGQVMTEPRTVREISGAPDPGSNWTPSDEDAAKAQVAKGKKDDAPAANLFGSVDRFSLPKKGK